MGILSESGQHALDRLLRPVEQDEEAQRQTDTVTWGPTLRKIRDPVQPISDVIARMDEHTQGRGPNSWLRKNAGKGDAFSGRDCCMTMIKRLERTSHRLQMPSEHECPGCGTAFVLEIGPVSRRA